ncbi:MAG: hypothetical protein H0V47_02460 [Chloroflexia bacterium]|jgi:hypothetical protein|nr:hypothetical protein [Chloroflexia bacterium]
MRRLSSPEHEGQASPWLWLVVTFLLICVALNGFFMVTQFESDGDVMDRSELPTIVAAPSP